MHLNTITASLKYNIPSQAANLRILNLMIYDHTFLIQLQDELQSSVLTVIYVHFLPLLVLDQTVEQ